MVKISLLIACSFSISAFAQFDNLQIPTDLKNKVVETVKEVEKTTGPLLNKIPQKTTTGLAESEIINGLKEALKVGSKNAGTQLNKVDGFNKNALLRIPFPPDAQKVADKLRQLGMGKKVDEFETVLNRSAEKAAIESINIFANAITTMSITDAKNILNGGNNIAATEFLKAKTSSQLSTAFRPHIESALRSTTATSKWKDITSIYNKIPGMKPVNSDLIAYTTEKALKGLFSVVGDEEKKIRLDPIARVTDILKKVFGQKQ